MKHPALARVMAVTLAIMCVIMLITGALGFGKTENKYAGDTADYEKLTDRITTYKELTEKLADAESVPPSRATPPAAAPRFASAATSTVPPARTRVPPAPSLRPTKSARPTTRRSPRVASSCCSGRSTRRRTRGASWSRPKTPKN